MFRYRNCKPWVYDKGDIADHSATPLFNPGIPKADHIVRLSYGDFSKFTVTSPDDADPPTLAHNPFVGPVPFSTTHSPSDPPGITLKRTTGQFDFVTFDEAAGELRLTDATSDSVPEPASIATVFSVMVLGLRRRKRKAS